MTAPREQAAPIERAAARPYLEHAVDGDRDDWDSEMPRQDRRALPEGLHFSVNGPLAFGKQHEYLAVLQPECASLHRAKQVRVGIHRNDVQLSRQPCLQRTREVFGGADEEEPPEEGKW